ncbi:hypothetical protein RHGRI_002700 [Rhododendron griersonianum]|uniref:Cyclin N-terminal domain-containing protein n=1 Tax=Rhododendron griersonianum TaxID=479676 RepID=A0AAV6LQS4_9ERIC|nr:hypothetical protein RHGRI_002700 [Rhododendron griersonianum]
MASNFWTSSHYKQLLDQEEVDVVHQLDREKGITLEDFKLIKMHMANCIHWQIGSTRKSEAKHEHVIGSLIVAIGSSVTVVSGYNSCTVIDLVVATAVAYMRRVYTKYVLLRPGVGRKMFWKSMTEYDPRVLAPTCLYLASKAEESTVQARLLVFYTRKIYTDEKYRYEIKDILEMEMKILEALNYYLVVFHPYRALSQ